MFQRSKAALLPLWAVAGLLMFGPMPARAQTTPPDPADAKARVPSAQYVSPLRGYQGAAPTSIAPWRESNELVRQRGGWRGYAAESRGPQPATPPSAASAPAASAASGGHAGHGMK